MIPVRLNPGATDQRNLRAIGSIISFGTARSFGPFRLTKSNHGKIRDRFMGGDLISIRAESLTSDH